MKNSLPYRPEVDGLRALAVLPVIFFHAGFKIFSGGFIGVDVFFVISGYLITAILIREMKADQFTFAGFYERRARRILPALFTMIICCIPFALLWMFPKEMVSFAESIISVCFFVSNIFFWQQVDYFNTNSQLEPLIHTWSLAVEEQFYIVFPLLLGLIWKFARSKIVPILVVLLVASLSYSQYLSHKDLSTDFYLAPSRAWELLAGAICVFASFTPHAKRDNIVSLIGLGMVIGAVFLFNATMPLPSLLSAIPVGGAALILLFAVQGTIAARILSLKPLVGIGLISYSAYLWHQPIFAFVRLRMIWEPSPKVMFYLCLLTLAIAYLSWKFVERPWRAGGATFSRPRPVLVRWAVSSGLVLAAFGLVGVATAGLPGRFPAKILAISDGSNDSGPFLFDCMNDRDPGPAGGMPMCHLGVKKDKLDFVVVGDSFSGALAGGINDAAIAHDKAGVLLAVPACPPLIGVGGTWERSRRKCIDFQNNMVSLVQATGAKTVVLAANWQTLTAPELIKLNKPDAKNPVEAFTDAAINTVASLHAKDLDVFVICCVPYTHMTTPQNHAKIQLFNEPDDIGRTNLQARQDAGWSYILLDTPEIKKYATFIDVLPTFCRGEGRCLSSIDDHPLFIDKGGHLSYFGSRWLAPTLGQIFEGPHLEP